MPHEKVAGTFTSVKDDAFVDYIIKSGTPKDVAEGLRGTTWKFTNSFTDDGKIVNYATCEEVPSMNQLISVEPGVEKEIDHPMLGGKGKMKFVFVGENKVKTETSSANLGDTVTDEVYTDEGVTFTTKNSKGETLTEFWPREVNEEGWFKFEKEENMAAFNKALGLPAELNKAMKTMTLNVSKCGANTYNIKETFGDFKLNNKYTLDKESTNDLPELNWSRKVLVTRTGPGKLLSIAKGPNGECEQWTSTYTDNGLVYDGVDKKSGLSAKLWLKRYVPLTGKFRMMASSGYDEFGAAMGMPADMISKVKTDFTAVGNMEETDGVYRYTTTSKVFPMDISFKFNEEFDFKFPGTNDIYKTLYTLNGNIMSCVSKGPNVTLLETITVTDNFIVQEVKIAGTNITAKIVHERL